MHRFELRLLLLALGVGAQNLVASYGVEIVVQHFLSEVLDRQFFNVLRLALPEYFMEVIWYLEHELLFPAHLSLDVHDLLHPLGSN